MDELNLVTLKPVSEGVRLVLAVPFAILLLLLDDVDLADTVELSLGALEVFSLVDTGVADFDLDVTLAAAAFSGLDATFRPETEWECQIILVLCTVSFTEGIYHEKRLLIYPMWELEAFWMCESREN